MANMQFQFLLSSFCILGMQMTKATDGDTYDCGANNPCTAENANNGEFYFPYREPSKFVECTFWGFCLINPCPQGENWDQITSQCLPYTLPGNLCLSNLKNIAVYEGQLNTYMGLPSLTWSVLPTSDEPSLQTIMDVGYQKNPSLAQLYDPSQSGLIIKNATTIGDPISTAGLYVGKCVANEEFMGAKLLVVRTGPECSSVSINSTSSNISCSVTYADSTLHPISPTITWSLNGNYLQSYTPPRERIDLFVFFTTATITTNSGSSNDNYQCELTFDAPTEIQYDWIATNAPTFKESCSTNP